MAIWSEEQREQASQAGSRRQSASVKKRQETMPVEPGVLKSPIGYVYAAGKAEKPSSETAVQPGCEGFEGFWGDDVDDWRRKAAV